MRALPGLKKLDNVEVTPEEIVDAQKGQVQRDEEVYEDAYSNGQPVPAEAQQQYHAQQQQQQQHHHPQQQQQAPPPQQQQQWRGQSPVREVG